MDSIDQVGIEKSNTIAEMSFEEALNSLEKVVENLDRGNTTLDEAIELYVYGTQLRKHCSTKLDSAQKRVAEIQKQEPEILQS